MLDFSNDPASAGRSVAPPRPRRQTATINLGCGARSGTNPRRVRCSLEFYVRTAKVSPAETTALLPSQPGTNPSRTRGTHRLCALRPGPGAAVVAASVLGATASSSRNAAATCLAANTALAVVAGPLDAATSANASSATAESSVSSASPAELFVGPPCERRVRGRGGDVGGVSHGFGRGDF